MGTLALFDLRGQTIEKTDGEIVNIAKYRTDVIPPQNNHLPTTNVFVELVDRDNLLQTAATSETPKSTILAQYYLKNK